MKDGLGILICDGCGFDTWSLWTSTHDCCGVRYWHAVEELNTRWLRTSILDIYWVGIMMAVEIGKRSKGSFLNRTVIDIPAFVNIGIESE
jgi:hypothetical protein